jgi:hypothetical protein
LPTSSPSCPFSPPSLNSPSSRNYFKLFHFFLIFIFALTGIIRYWRGRHWICWRSYSFVWALIGLVPTARAVWRMAFWPRARCPGQSTGNSWSDQPILTVIFGCWINHGNPLIDWLIDWLIHWLIDWLFLIYLHFHFILLKNHYIFPIKLKKEFWCEILCLSQWCGKSQQESSYH